MTAIDPILTLKQKTTLRWFWCFLVAQGGIEPPTQKFSTLKIPIFQQLKGIAYIKAAIGIAWLLCNHSRWR